MHNQINDIIRRLFKKNALEEVSDAELENFIAQYPYVSAGRYLLAQKRYNSDPSSLAAEQQTAALYIHNPLWLPWLLDQNYAGAAALPATGHAAPYKGASGAYNTGITEELLTPPEETTAIGESDNGDVEPLSGSPELADAETSSATQRSANAADLPETEVSLATQEYAETKTPDETGHSSEVKASVDIEDAHQTEPPLDARETADTEITPEANTDPEPGVFDTEDPLEMDISPGARFFKDAENATEAETSSETEDFTDAGISSAAQTPADTEITPEANADSDSGTSDAADLLEADTPSDAQAFTDTDTSPQTETSSEIREQADTETASGVQLPASTADRQEVTASQTDPVSDEHDRPIVFQSYHTIDYFASQGIRLQPSDFAQDKLGQQLKSFTEWLKSMKKLSTVADPAKEADPEEASLSKRVVSIAEHSLEEKEIVTEAMAEVWAKQGNVQKATDIYQKLSLRNPHKNAYFAAKIKQLNVS